MPVDELRVLLERHARPDLATAIDGVRICKTDHAAAPGSSMSGMVLAVTGYVWESGVGAVFGREAVLITPDGPEVLTSSPSATIAVGA